MSSFHDVFLFTPFIGRRLINVERPDDDTLVLHFEGDLSLTVEMKGWQADWHPPTRSLGLPIEADRSD